MGGEEFLERPTQGLKSVDPVSQVGQFFQSGIRPAAAVEEAIDVVHDRSQDSQMGQATGDALEDRFFSGGQDMLDEQMSVFEEIGDPILDSFVLSCRLLCPGAGRPSAGPFRLLLLEFLASLGDGVEDGPGDLLEDVEFTELMLHLAKDLANRFGIQRGTVGGDPPATSDLGPPECPGTC